MSSTNNTVHIVTDTNILEPDETISAERLSDIVKAMPPLKPDLIKTHSRIEIQFGYGKVLIAPVMREDKAKGAIVLQPNRGTGIVGEDTFSESANDILLSFANTKSIDVLVRRLEQLKRMMNGQEDGLKESDYDL